MIERPNLELTIIRSSVAVSNLLTKKIKWALMELIGMMEMGKGAKNMEFRSER